MASYVIGDLQGCFTEFKCLLDKIQFKPDCDQLWLTGDLVNRGPDSLKVLQYVYAMRDNLITVLGNHDLHLLAIASGRAQAKRRDTLDQILDATNADHLLHWLQQQPLMHYDANLNYALVHAGVAPHWDLQQCLRLAQEAQGSILDSDHNHFFDQMYGDTPRIWSEDLAGVERIRYIVNCFTRIRYCSREGQLELTEKQAPGHQPPHLLPWFEVPNRPPLNCTLLFGHWSTLGFFKSGPFICLDSGCLWGGFLTALELQQNPEAHFQAAMAAQSII